jgi:hypothetical protein
MKPDRSSTSPFRRFMRPIIGVATVLVVSAGAVAVAQGASPDRAPSAASTTPVTGESMVVESSAVVGAEAVESSIVEQAAASTEGHPIVGAWLYTPESSAEGRRHPAAFSSDGIYWQFDAQNLVGIGVWEPTGPISAAVTFVDQIPDGAGGLVTETVRALVEVAPDGQSFTAEFTVEESGGGFPEGQYGPGSVSATRMAVEPMGTPAGTLDDLFAGFSEGTEAPPTTG